MCEFLTVVVFPIQFQCTLMVHTKQNLHVESVIVLTDNKIGPLTMKQT